MKTILLMLVLAGTLFISNHKENKVTSKYDCIIPSVDEGRCTGSAYCSACRNCSRCAHCSNGGSCGVCSSSTVNYESPKPVKKSKTIPQSFIETEKIFYKNETITIYSDLINLREKPSLKAKVLEKITVGDEILFIQKEGEWSKVQVKKTGTIGYIFSKLLIKNT